MFHTDTKHKDKIQFHNKQKTKTKIKTQHPNDKLFFNSRNN